MGQFSKITSSPLGAPHREWASAIPNDGLLYYTTAFNAENVMVTSPKAIGQVLAKTHEFVKTDELRHGAGRILGESVLLAEGDEHKQQRKLLAPAFSFRHVKDLHPVFWSKARQSVSQMSLALNSDTNILEISSWAQRTTLDTIGVAAVGQEFHSLEDPDNELREIYRSIFTPSIGGHRAQILALFLPHWLIRILLSQWNRNIEMSILSVKKICRQLIVTKRTKIKKHDLTDVDILSVALNSGAFSDEDIVEQLMTFLAAGHETTASSLTWAVYLLCKHPGIQTRLRSEVRAALPSVFSKTGIVATDIDHIPYLHAVCNEVLRVFPPVPLSFRVAKHNTAILNQHIPANTIVVLAPWATNVSTDLWGPDAAAFNPDRWTQAGQANAGGAKSNNSFLTFSNGPRMCIGVNFARAEFACLLAAWVGRFEFEFADPEYQMEVQVIVTARPKGGLSVKVNEVEGW
ncbi:MAG: hypothetical protein M1821_002114 [Bathelium mastoideum]|nr:MAG: hypothetical protein M1821_002114 [Bathelium mastoideum]